MIIQATSQEDLEKKRAERTQKLKDSMEAAATYDVPTAKGDKKGIYRHSDTLMINRHEYWATILI